MKESQLRLLILEIVKQAKLFKEELSHNCTAHDITWKGSQGYQCLNCGAWAEHSWDIKHKLQPSSKKSKFFENDLNKTLSPKSIATIEKWRRELGDRKTAVKLIDTVLERRIGIVSADLPDTATFANGLDAIEVLLKDGKYDSAIQQAIETAKDMVEEEGGEGLMESDNKTEWYEYKLMGLAPEVPEGHEFRSKVVDLEKHPELWQSECPYSISDKNLKNVEIIKINEGTENKKNICQKCKGQGHYTTTLKDRAGRNPHGLGTTHIVPCDFPGCHGGIVDREENRRAQGIIPHGPGCGCNLKEDEKEPSEDALYVEYLKEMPGEKPFMLRGEKFQYVKAKYPDGKEDIGVYAFRGDLVYGYKAFRKRYNLKEGNRVNAIFDKDKKCMHPNGFEWSGRTPNTGIQKCRMCGEEKPSRKQVPRLGMF